MGQLTFEDIRKNKDGAILLYEYVRGSTCQGINTPTSDIDHGGVYMCPTNQLFGLGFDYCDEVSSEKHDDSWFELNKFMRLLCKSNPTVLEALFVDDEFVVYEHPIMTEIKKNKDVFLTKECFKPFGGYAVSQIEKARGLNKKIAWDKADTERKGVLDFCYTFNKQGSQPIVEWLEERGLKQENCGLVNIPNMKDTYGVYYDFGQHLKLEGVKNAQEFEMYCFENDNFKEFLKYSGSLRELYEDELQKPKGGYCGIVSRNEDVDSNTVRLTSIPDKNEVPICYMTYNKDAYTCHCRRYKEYCDWKKNRNKVRYENNLGHDYDAKNMSHSFRLVQMCIEIARGEGMKVRRTEDKDFLLDIRAHKFSYDELMEMLTKKKQEMDDAIKASTITETVDVNAVNDILVKLRWQQVANNFAKVIKNERVYVKN